MLKRIVRERSEAGFIDSDFEKSAEVIVPIQTKISMTDHVVGSELWEGIREGLNDKQLKVRFKVFITDWVTDSLTEMDEIK